VSAHAADSTEYSIKGVTMATVRAATGMETSNLVLNMALPNDDLFIMPFVVLEEGAGMILEVKFDGRSLSSFIERDFREGKWNFLHMELGDLAGESGELEIILSSAEPAALVFVQDVREPDSWPWYYSGVSPAPALQLGVNNIATLDTVTSRMYACVRIETNGQSSQLRGIERFDMEFDVNLPEATVRVINTRPFNPTNAKTLTDEVPHCSGVYETTTQRYEDTIQVGLNTYRVSFNLFDGNAMQLRILNAVKL
jgi:hypothetical protein